MSLNRTHLFIIFLISGLVIGMTFFLIKNQDIKTKPVPIATVIDIGNVNEKKDLITIQTPLPNDRIVSPLEIRGAARGYWFFEASFPIYLYNEAGVEIAHGVATATESWMTEDFVPYKATLEFTSPLEGTGKLTLKKDNPSGLPENDDELYIPVKF